MARRLARTLLDSAALAPILSVLERVDSRRPNLLRALTYHRLDDAGAFERQMRHLADRYNVVGAGAVLQALRGGGRLPPRSVLITFDDGYPEVGEVAWPILRRLGLPAVLFVPTAYPGDLGRPFWWDLIEDGLRGTPRRDVLDSPAGALPLGTAAQRRRACSALKRSMKSLHHDQARERAESIARELAPPIPPPGAPGTTPPQRLDWDALRRLSREGLTMAPHSRTHPFMDLISAAEAHQEVAGSLADLRRELGTAPLPIFSYPDGRHGPGAVAALRSAGIVAAFTTRRGTNDLDADEPLTLRRINMSAHADEALLRARLVHSSVYLNRWRRLFDRQRQPLPTPEVHHAQ